MQQELHNDESREPEPSACMSRKPKGNQDCQATHGEAGIQSSAGPQGLLTGHFQGVPSQPTGCGSLNAMLNYQKKGLQWKTWFQAEDRVGFCFVAFLSTIEELSSMGRKKGKPQTRDATILS